MRIELINQVPGYKSIGDILKALLQNKAKGYFNLKLLMAFVNLNGLNYIKVALEAFYDSDGTLELIVGLDNGITTYEALKYLITRFPKASIFLFHDKSPDIIFHPKTIILEGKEIVTCIIGSTNLTLGGLYSNFETALLLEADKQEDQEQISHMASLWDAYRKPSPPLSPTHLVKLSSEWLEKNRGKFPTKKERQQANKQQRKSRFSEFATIQFKRPRTTPPKQAIPRSPKAPKAKVERGNKLYLEILSETREGNQVQVPTTVVPSYFRGSLSQSKPLCLSINGAPYRDVWLTHFPNHTHRISISELTDVPRPAILVFNRVTGTLSNYTCVILTGHDYEEALTHCTKQTRAGARHWGIE